MSHGHTDGTLIVAQLKRRVRGGAVYSDLTIRQEAGGETKLRRIVVDDDVNHAMAPGSAGRFYHFDVLGQRGIHGFRPIRGKSHVRFPRKWELILSGMGIANLLLALLLFIGNGRLPIFPVATGTFALVLGIMFTTTRIAATRAYLSDDLSTPSPGDRSPALEQS